MTTESRSDDFQSRVQVHELTEKLAAEIFRLKQNLDIEKEKNSRLESELLGLRKSEESLRSANASILAEVDSNKKYYEESIRKERRQYRFDLQHRDDELGTLRKSSSRDAQIITQARYEDVLILFHQLQHRHTETSNSFESLRKEFADLRMHAYVLDKDKGALMEHVSRQENHMLYLERELKELKRYAITCENQIEIMKKEKAVVDIVLAQKIVMADRDLQAKVGELEAKLAMREDQTLVIANLNEKVKKIEKKYGYIKQYNQELKEFIHQYEDFIEKSVIDGAKLRSNAFI